MQSERPRCFVLLLHASAGETRSFASANFSRASLHLVPLEEEPRDLPLVSNFIFKIDACRSLASSSPQASLLMAANLLAEYKGFLLFIKRANDHLLKWFGPHCNNDPVRLVFLASRDWDGMGDLEKKPFIRLNIDKPRGVNPYFRYLLKSRYSGESSFDPKTGRQHSENWKSLTAGEREQYAVSDHTEAGMDHVIQKRDELHSRFEPQELSLLEFILKTKPHWPASSRLWFYRYECHSLRSSEAKLRWETMNAEDRGVYERCALLDRKRYNFEKNAWITKMISLDIESDKFTLSDFHIPEIKSKIDALGSFVDMSRDLPSLVTLKRPRNPFSLFIERYRYQIRDERPGFQFGRHLKECSDAWSKLSDQERDYYKHQSKKLRDLHRDLLARESNGNSNLTVPSDLFTNKSIDGPCRPSHLHARVPNSMSLWARENPELAKGNCREKWRKLSDEEKETYIRMRQELKKASDEEKKAITRKHNYIKLLIRDSAKLEDLKQELKLIGSSKKIVKNLYY